MCETGFHHVVQTSVKLMTSPSVGFIGMHHRVWLTNIFIVYYNCVYGWGRLCMRVLWYPRGG